MRKEFMVILIALVLINVNIIIVRKGYLVLDTSSWEISNNEELNALSPEQLNWGVDDINAERVWGGEENAIDICANPKATGRGINIAVIDIGIDYTHFELVERFSYPLGRDYYKTNNDNDPMDEAYDHSSYGHGTFCAGIIASSDNDRGLIGVAPEANIFALRWSDNWNYEISDIGECLKWILKTHDKNDINYDPKKEIHVVSMSMHHSRSIRNPITDALYDSLFNHGICIVSASGNDGRDDFISYPAKHRNVIAVGAVGKSQESYKLWEFSNYDTDTGDKSVDFVAPGVDITSTHPSENDALLFTTASGTSAAAPHVAGVVALMLDANPVLKDDPKKVKELLSQTALDLGDEGYDDIYGWGMVQAEKAVTKAIESDIDGDNLKDIWEVSNNFDPFNSSDGCGDLDKDGLPTNDEVNLWKTNWNDKDSDDDNWTDGQECAIYGTNPLDSNDTPLLDHDNDGISTLDEVDGFYIEGIGIRHTDPFNPDSDGDNYTEGYECNPISAFLPSDPTDPTSVPTLS
jgi:subtilisin family serine protease